MMILLGKLLSVIGNSFLQKNLGFAEKAPASH